MTGDNIMKIKNKKLKLYLTDTLILLVVILLAIACGDAKDKGSPTSSITGKVTNASREPVRNAKVYLIPTSAINKQSVSQANILDTTNNFFENLDEPLEDTVRLKGSELISAITDSFGNYTIASKLSDEKYYIYVQPSDTDLNHLPGGDKSRVAKSKNDLVGSIVDIKVSGSPSDSATYIGSSECIACHQDYAGVKYTAHKLGVAVPGKTGGLQNKQNFPYYDDTTSWKIFKTTDSYAGGTKLIVGDHDSSRGFDKFKVYEDSTKVTTPFGEMYLWKDRESEQFKITIVNLINPLDSNSPLTLPVKLTYGGTVYKQRFLVEIPKEFSTSLGSAQRKGLYPLLQFQGYPGISNGKESNYNRSMSKWRDYHLDWWWDKGLDGTFGTSDDSLKLPSPLKTFEAKCATCHFTGYNDLKLNTLSGEWLADAVDDSNGVYDIDGDGAKDELNIGCESCHGPGSEHKVSNDSKNIVSVSYLSPSRENMICGTCHDRSAGLSSDTTPDLKNGDMLFNHVNKLPKPGMSRAQVIKEHTSRPSAAISALHIDKKHSKSHHQQYADFLKSKHYRNDKQLVVCSDCHDVHAKKSLAQTKEFKHNMVADPADPTSSLCSKCHNLEYTEHMEIKTAAQHAGAKTACSDCHMPRTAKSGAGMQSLSTAGTTTPSDSNTYVMGDISSHLFDFVSKFNLGVSGSTPGKAMSAPYTNECAACHSVKSLESKTPFTE